ncbi:MAG TPA: SNF2-related protein [Verrucomicrobiae bacterium]
MEQRTSINPACLQEVLDSARNAAEKGQAQFHTPAAFGQLLASALPVNRTAVVDLNCGNGSLLYAAAHPKHTRYLLGLDIDPRALRRPPEITKFEGTNTTHKITGDLTRTWHHFNHLSASFDCFALNPPWDLWWYREPLMALADSDVRAVAEAFQQHDGRVPAECIDSTVATMMIALHLMQSRGEGFIIANAATIARLIYSSNAPHSALKQHIYAMLTFPGNPMTGTDDFQFAKEDETFSTVVLYFARSHKSGLQFDVHFDAVPATLPVHQIRAAHLGAEIGSSFDSKGQQQKLWWEAVAEESRRLKGQSPSPFNLWMEPSGRICTALSLYEQFDGRVDKELASTLHELQGKLPMQLVLKRSDRQALEHAAFGGVWRVQPQLQAAVKAAVTQYHANRAPLRPLPEIQRLGYLDEQDSIECKEDMRVPGTTIFLRGAHYRISTRTYVVKRTGNRYNNSGIHELIEYSGSELFFFITDEHGTERVFVDDRLRQPGSDLTAAEINDPIEETFSIQLLVQHFIIPSVPDVAEVQPEKFAAMLDRFGSLVADINGLLARVGRSIKPKNFQTQDLCRATMHHGILKAWDTGLGKTWATFLWALLKVGWHSTSEEIVPDAAVLITAPGDLHDAISGDEGWENFRIRVTFLETQDDFYRLSQVDPHTGKRTLPNGFYITSYHQLGMNGVKEIPDHDGKGPDEWMAALNLSLADVITEWNTGIERGDIDPKSSDCKRWHLLSSQQQWHIKFRFCSSIRNEWLATLGSERQGITCTYSPKLSDLVRDCFACVVVDEGTRLQGGFETELATGVLNLRPAYRIVLSATPIKGRLSQIFWLLWWVCGGEKEAHARWPYAGTEDDKMDFSKTYLIAERNLTAEEEGRNAYNRLSPQVCNVHGLWKLFGPIILRRLKADIGEDMVKKHESIIRVPFGSMQKEVYEYHLGARYLNSNGRADPGGRMSALRMAAAAPTSEKLRFVENDKGGKLYRSTNEFTPKIGCALNLIQQIISRGEQVVVASFFKEPLLTLARLLKEAGVPFCLLDGDKSPAKRKPISQQFKQGVSSGIAVNLSSFALAEGHNWFLCPNMIILTYTWESDKMKQMPDRIWRLPSPKDVNIWKIICDGSIELRADELSNEKNDASSLVLDGQLLPTHPREVSLWEIAQEAIENYDQHSRAIPEESIQAQWPRLKAALEEAAKLFKQGTPLLAPLTSETIAALPYAASTERVMPRFQRGATSQIPDWKRKLWTAQR